MIHGDQTVTLQGPTWINGLAKSDISISSLASKILCDKHNSALSFIDDEMKGFIRYLTGKADESGIAWCDGHTIEKWFVKAQVGFLASGYAHGDLKGWTASQRELSVLFGNAQLGQGSGLYFLSGPHEDEQESIALMPIEGPETMSMAGIALLISGLPFFYLAIPPWPSLIRKIQPLRLHYRPAAINIRHGSDEREVRTGWQNGDIVEIDISGPHY